ncbi:hypothetical protein LOD99_16242 [Oopsacas minuta]|uniref:Uncharacterized protein n=1 Tax=Oopsacas minuta TaxID=111878 RepID=A0AAV7K7H7_9METZ|nr:hypothetical protein LOD99_16242 [Oopsacas minuta]
MEDVQLMCSSINFDKEDFETMTSDVRSKIHTYFSQLIEVIQSRENKLISELDAIISEFRNEREKFKELEKMKKYHQDLYSSSTFKNLQADILGKIEKEITGMKEETMDKMVLEFEWNQKYAREANELGKLKKTHPTDNDVTKNVEVVNSFAPSLEFRSKPQGISNSPSKTIPQSIKSQTKPLNSPVLVVHQTKNPSFFGKSLRLSDQKSIKRKFSLNNPEILKRTCPDNGKKLSKSSPDDNPLPDPSSYSSHTYQL